MTSAITDFAQFDRMRLDAKSNDPAVLREAAGQFEAIFVGTLLKNMRSSSLADPLFGNSDQLEMYQGMMDQQLAVELSSGRGIGIADMLVRQLGGDTSTESTHQPHATAVLPAVSSHRISQRLPVAAEQTIPPKGPVAEVWSGPADFATQLWPHAERAARKLGIAPENLLAQAALETGWGEHVMQRPNGGSSLNVFGIKAGPEWDGASVAKSTLEFKDGVAHRQLARFRSYPDIGSSFDDYAKLIAGSPGYASVLGSGADTSRFANALQAAGYATDPQYADKIGRVLRGDTMQGVLRLLKGGLSRPLNQLISRVSGR